MAFSEHLVFLNNHPMKTNEKEWNTHWQFHFSYRVDSVVSSGIIDIPKNENEEFRWIYREMDESKGEVLHFKQNAKHNFTELPDGWFSEIITHLIQLLHKRDRIRLMFNGGK